jgi:hypothetical protein
MKHIMDYSREPFSFMTKCGLIVGPDHLISEGEESDCPGCSQTVFRKDEPEMPFPNVDGMPVEKEERYGD